MTAEPLGPWDPGLQNERTTLAWDRTALALGGSGVLLARHMGSLATAAMVLVGVGIVITWILVRVGHRHGARVQALEQGQPVVEPWRLAALAGVVAAMATAGLVVILL